MSAQLGHQLVMQDAPVCDARWAWCDAGSAEAASRKAKRRQHANIEYEEEREYENPRQSQTH